MTPDSERVIFLEKNKKQKTEGQKTVWFDTRSCAPKQKLLPGTLLLVLMLAAACCLGVISLYFSTGLYTKDLLSYYLEQPRLVVLNTVPYLLVCFLVWFLTDRAWLGFAAGGLAALVYSFADYWKLLSRDDPVYAADLAVFSEALEMSGEYIKVPPVMILAVLSVLGGVIFLFLLFRKTRLFSWKLRVVLCVLTGLLAGGLYGTVYTSKKVYDSFEVWEPLNPLFDNSKYISRGGIYPFIYSIQTAVPTAPEGYHKDEAKAALEDYPSDVIPEDKKVSVIMVMLEAFCDLSEETDLITEGDPYESYHKLQAESYTGKLVTNIFAGGTIDTERCVLTGFSELTSFQRPSWSYARYFAQQGYSLNGSHGGYRPFYSRGVVNENLGFDEYYFVENHYNKFSGEDVSMDWILLPEITRICTEQIQQGETVFSFNVTYQNHGPYHTTLWESRVPFVAEGAVNADDYGIVNNYLNGVMDTGNRLLAMADAFRDSEEPVILVFFGDHKPWLGPSASTYEALGIDLVSGSDDSFYNHYETDYVIWGNDAARAALGTSLQGEGPSVSPCFLMNVLFDVCGWDGPSYQKLTDEVMEITPVITTNERYVENGVLVEEEALSSEAVAYIDKMRKVQYYLAMDSGGVLPDA